MVPSGKRWSWGLFVDSLGPAVSVGLVTRDGTVVHANRAALDIVGVDLEEIAGTPFHRTPWYLQAAKASQAKLDEALAAGQVGQSSRFDLHLRTPDGRELVLDFALRPVLHDDGRVAFLVPSACNVTARREAERRAAYASEHDLLTGIRNRAWLNRHLAEQLRLASDSRPVTILTIDIDGLARINASLGQSTGDAVLRSVASRFLGCLDEGDVLARIDGDEFVVALAPGHSHASVSRMALALLNCLADGIDADGREVFVTASIGVATAAANGSDLDALKRRAAVALDRARAKGRNNHVVCLQLLGEDEPDRWALETALRRAIARRELRLVYQPQVDIASGTIIGVEALLRWDHPVLGAVSPERFIPIAEEAGLIGEIGDWVCRTACSTASGWQRAGLPPVRTMVNLSACQVQQGGLAARIEAMLAETGLEPCRFGVEITESVLIQELDEAVRELSRLRDLGVKVALDDFGTGYSSLSYLSRLPLDVVKIDRSLVPAVTGDSHALPIARAIVAMSHSLGLKVMAEGVENESQLELLAANRCDHFQGYHFSEPVAAENVEFMLRNGRRLRVLERRRSAHACAVLAVDNEPAVTERLEQELHWHYGENRRIGCGASEDSTSGGGR